MGNVGLDNLPVNQVILGDCREVMKSLPPKSVDLVLTDPPYGLEDIALIRRKGGKFGQSTDIGRDLLENPEVVRGVRFEEWVPLALNLLKDNGVLITMCHKRDISRIWDYLEELGMTVRHVGAWVKSNPPPQARKVKWMDAWEPFIIATKNEGMGHHYDWTQGQRGDVIVTSICQGKERLDHPTQKPLALAEPLVRWWSYLGDLVLDPFCGTGTFLVAAKKLGRRFLGIEINPKYVEMARRRLAETEWPLEYVIGR